MDKSTENERQSQPSPAVKPNEEEFSQFINTYALSFGANHFLAAMDSKQRIRFFITVSKTYPDDWKAALIQLATEEQEAKTTGR